MRSDFNMNAFNEATLFGGDSIMITDDRKYKIKDFAIKPQSVIRKSLL
jgi:hypothetical protein